jgi:hypothetical protein
MSNDHINELPSGAIIADADKMSPQDFARSLGLNIRTPEQKLAEWNAGVLRYVELILSGCDCSSHGNPQVIEAKRRIAEGGQLTEVASDPLPHLEPRRAA